MGAEASRGEVAAQAAQAAQAAVQAVQAASGLGAIVATRPAASGLLLVRDPVAAGGGGGGGGREEWVMIAPPGAPGGPPEAKAAAMTGAQCLEVSAQMIRLAREAPLRGEDLRRTMENLSEAMALLAQRRSEVEHRAFVELKRAQRTCCKCDVTAEDTYADLVELSNCGHCMCTDCFRTHVLAMAPRPCCMFPFCECAIAEQDVRATLRPEELEAYTSAGLRNIADQICQCPKCQSVIALDRDKNDARNAGRVRCVCRETFCADCRVSPFHEGITCEELRATRPCKFCKSRVVCGSPDSDPGEIVVCQEAACQQEARILCGRQREGCGHPCGGLADETACPAECFECLGAARCCGVCLFPLEEGASIVLSCGHPMHVNCVRERFAAEKSAERASLTFSRCPVCKADMAHPEALEAEFLAVSELRSSIRSVLDEARARAPADEAVLEDDAFTLFYCARCRRPYFGGMRRCEEAGGGHGHEQARASAAEAEAENAQHRYCSSCTCALQQVSVCPDHGPDSMQFKCSFCCTPASFFCWGTTHFCVDCHARQMAGERLNKLSIADLPQCGGAEGCPLGLNHPPNGTPPSQSAPVVLGCSMCQARRALM